MPRRDACRMARSRIELATIAFDGMQSHKWAAPPTIWSSTSVTSKPKVAACVAAECPAGPPPITSSRGPSDVIMGRNLSGQNDGM